jgi:OmcA/MtrC family decaheme c-type cytochrome
LLATAFRLSPGNGKKENTAMMRFPAWAAAGTGLLLLVACSGDDGAKGAKGNSGAPGQPCTVASNADGSATITCPDGTTVKVPAGTKGDPGHDGDAGPAGPPGDSGVSCSIVDNKDGTKTITCTDGTSVTVQSTLKILGDLSSAEIAALDPELTITGVDFSPADGKPVVSMKITDKSGNPLAGFDSLTTGAGVTWRFALLKLDANVNGSANDTWVSYLAGGKTYSAGTESAATTATPPDAGVNDAGVITSTTGVLKDNGDGTYTYTFGRNIKDEANAGTKYEDTKVHRIIALAYKSNNPFRPMNAWKDLIPSTGSDESGKNDKVNGDSCLDCHSEWRASANKTGAFHGGTRYEVHVCPACHNDQRRFSSSGVLNTEPSMTAGTTAGTVKWTGTANVINGEAVLNLPVFIHKIHMGEELGLVPDRANGSGQYAGVQFDEVTYPQDVRNCTKCHNTVAKADNWKTVPSRRACNACHDTTSFEQTVPFGRTAHPGGPASDDSSCAMCHGAGKTYAVDAKHIPVAAPATITTGTVPYSPNGWQVIGGWQWDSATGTAKTCNMTTPCTCTASAPCLPSANSNAASLAATGYVPTGAAKITYDVSEVKVDANKHPQIVFKILKDGTAVDFGTYDATNKPELITGFVGSPSAFFAWSVPQDGIAAPADFNASTSAYIKGVWSGAIAPTVATLTKDTTTGYYTLTKVDVTLPSSAKMLTGGIGYTYSMTSTQPLTQTDLPNYPYSAATKIGGLIVPAPNVTKVATGYTARRPIVETARCNKCHDGLGVSPTFHAGQRNDAATCSFCHNVNRVNSGWAVNAKDFVHALHGAGKRGTDFTWHAEIGGWEITYPGVLNNCEQCHLPGTYDFSASATKSALPNMLYSYAATGTYSTTPTAPATAAPYLSPYITPGTAYGLGFTTSGTRTVGTQGGVACTTSAPCTCTLAAPCDAEDTTLVHSPITAACVACHDSPIARSHMLDNGGSFYSPRSAALAKPEGCLMCHGPGKVAAIADVHK